MTIQKQLSAKFLQIQKGVYFENKVTGVKNNVPSLSMYSPKKTSIFCESLGRNLLLTTSISRLKLLQWWYLWENNILKAVS